MIETFASNHTFAGDFDDNGTWSGGGLFVRMVWGMGNRLEGDKFKGTFTTTPVKQYSGGIGGEAAQLVKGVVSTYEGYTC